MYFIASSFSDGRVLDEREMAKSTALSKEWMKAPIRRPGDLLQSDHQRKEVVLILSHMLQGTLEVQGR
jgi:hypothetical protein